MCIVESYILCSPVAVLLLVVTCTVISVDDGLLRTSTGCTDPISSSTVYADWSKVIVESIKDIMATISILLQNITD